MLAGRAKASIIEDIAPPNTDAPTIVHVSVNQAGSRVSVESMVAIARETTAGPVIVPTLLFTGVRLRTSSGS